ncbi:TetR/AcrR family transcriptional regulator [Xylanimonas ulmi]|uniref:TetR family transcriptional regulator n=2 Tax=Xylanimonas ulmi TaxID=228973 RepID=A0A4Q7M1E5_9MICO|nr:TetR family transcriptional regulator [Xylanibacterium ulmi]
MRVDARRNRDNLVAVARTVMAEEGLDASLRDVARRAGVGIATLYRHFPTRDALVQAVLSDRLNALADAADESLAAPSPGEALAGWLHRFAAGSGAFHGLPGSVLAALHDSRSELHGSCVAMNESASRLLQRAQEAGEVRPDVDAEDLFTAAAAIGWAAQYSATERAERILTLLTNGMRAEAPETVGRRA